jgi:hypothetical protein
VSSKQSVCGRRGGQRTPFTAGATKSDFHCASVSRETLSLWEASANRPVPVIVELFDPTPSWCYASPVKIEIIASVSFQ